MAQSKMSKFTKDEKTPLKKWGKIVTSRIFSDNSFVNANIKKSLLQVVKAIRYSENPQVCIQQQSIPELLCYLPYLLGFACDTGYLHQIQVNITKPILIVSNTIADASCLMETIGGPLASDTKMLLKTKQVLTDSEMAKGAHYQSYLITDTDSIVPSDHNFKYDVIVCTTDCLPHLSHCDYSLVIGGQEAWDPALTGFKMYCSVVLLTYSSGSCITSPTLTKCSGPPLIDYADMIASGECPMPLLLEPQIHGIEEMLDRVTDFNCSHIPIEMNISRDKGLKELVYALPCLLGSAAIRNSGCLDLSKPVLFITTDAAAYTLVSGILPVIIPMEHKDTATPDFKGQYQCCLLKSEFEVCTFCQQVNSSEVMLTSTEFSQVKNTNEVVTNSFYKNIPSYTLSAVVIVQTKYLANKKEQDIVYHFRGVTTILIRANAESEKDKEEGKIKVVPKIVTVQQCSAELIYPTLMTHGNDITERFLLSQKSILTHYQQVGLANIVEWLGSSKGSSEVSFVTTAIGFKYAAMMLWCLPSMLEWADNNQLIPDRALNLRKPLLILCTKKESVDDLWNLVHSKSAFHQSSLLCSVSTCSDGKSLSCLATDTESAANTGNIAGQYKLVLSHIGCLDDLPKDAFSQIIVFKEGTISSNEVNAVSTKYSQKFNIIYFTAHPVGPMKKFELQNNFPSSLSQSDTSAADKATSLNKNELGTLNAVSCPIDVEKPLLSCQKSQEVEFEEEYEDIETIILPPDSTPQMPNIEKAEEELGEEDACNVEVQESFAGVEETTCVEIPAESMPDKKKKKKWRRVLRKKSKVPKTPQQNACSPEDPVHTITTMGHSSEHTQSDIDSLQQKKTSRWSKCKTFFRNISKNQKGRKRRSPSNNCSTSGSHEMVEDIGTDSRSTGLLMCWRRRSSNNKRRTKSSSDSCEEPESSDRGRGPMTWTDPVAYISNSKQKITMTCPQDIPENIPEDIPEVMPEDISEDMPEDIPEDIAEDMPEDMPEDIPENIPEDMLEEVQEDALSFASVALSDLSSLDILSLLEGDTSDINATSPTRNPLDTKGDADKMESVLERDLCGVQCVRELSRESELSHLSPIYHDAVNNKTTIIDITHSKLKTITET